MVFVFLACVRTENAAPQHDDETETKPTLSLTDAQIEEFQRLYEQHYGIRLTKDEALEKGLRLVRMLRATLQATAKKLQSKQNNI